MRSRLPSLRARRPACSVAFAALAASSVQAGVTTVAPFGADFTSIQAAVDAAPDGEIVLVYGGNYAGPYIDGKSVHVIADALTTVNLQSGIDVRNLGPDEAVTLHGFDVHFLLDGGLRLLSNQGPIRITNCTFVPDTIFMPMVNNPARISDCLDVVLTNTRLVGGASHLHGGTAALDVRGGNVALFGCDLEGGSGREGQPAGPGVPVNTPGGPGWPALQLQATTVFVAGARLAGGDGGKGVDGICGHPVLFPTDGGAGGAGVQILQPVTLRTLDTVSAGGAGGTGGTGLTCGAPSGSHGAPVFPPAAPVTNLAGAARALVTLGPAREGSTASLEFHGVPSDRAYLVLSTGREHTFEPLLSGTLHVASPLRRLFIGFVPASGVLNAGLPVPLDLGLGVEALHRSIQGILIDTGNQYWVSGPGELVLLDSSF